MTAMFKQEGNGPQGTSIICFIGSLVFPLLLAAYFIWQVKIIDASFIQLQGTISSFGTKGSHSSSCKIIKLEEHPATLLRYYNGIGSLLTASYHTELYEPVPPGEFESIYYLHPKLKSKANRQVVCYISKADVSRLNSAKQEINYSYLRMLPEQYSSVSYYADIFRYVVRHKFGVITGYASAMIFLLLVAFSSWWYERYNHY
jgi:hypothetical protein